MVNSVGPNLNPLFPALNDISGGFNAGALAPQNPLDRLTQMLTAAANGGAPLDPRALHHVIRKLDREIVRSLLGQGQGGLDPSALGPSLGGGLPPLAGGPTPGMLPSGLDPSVLGGGLPPALPPAGLDPNALGGGLPTGAPPIDPTALGGAPSPCGGAIDPSALGAIDPSMLGAVPNTCGCMLSQPLTSPCDLPPPPPCDAAALAQAPCGATAAPIPCGATQPPAGLPAPSPIAAPVQAAPPPAPPPPPPPPARKKSSPLTFDLNGDGKVSTTTLQNGRQFAMGPGGTQTAWAGAGDGILAFGAGKDGSQLFGNNTVVDGQKFANGFDALKALAQKHLPPQQFQAAMARGSLNQQDLQVLEQRANLHMKVAGNTPGEDRSARPVEDLGITQISLNYQQNGAATDANGNDHRQSAAFVQRGQTKRVDDVWYQNR